MTNVGFVHEGRELHVRACDPLADFYSDLAERHLVDRPLATEFAVAEDLSCYFEEDSFDIVHCRNALDHSADPVRGIVEMLRVVKKGGVVYLKHFPNEAETENYEGFHQFNFDVKNDRFVIWNKSESIDVLSVLPVSVEAFLSLEDSSVVVALRKCEDFNSAIRLAQIKNRAGRMQRAFIIHHTQRAAKDLSLI